MSALLVTQEQLITWLERAAAAQRRVDVLASCPYCRGQSGPDVDTEPEMALVYGVPAWAHRCKTHPNDTILCRADAIRKAAMLTGAELAEGQGSEEDAAPIAVPLFQMAEAAP